MADESTNLPERQNIIPINIEDEMRGAYIDYSMSVIVSRALPDVRDGLKPVHRRVLYGMLELGVNYNKPYKKSITINRIRNRLVLWGRYWVSITRMEMPQFTIPWYGWPRIGRYATRW